MKNVIRVPLPGYDAFTDTNLDHFALYTDEDNVLIKEFTRDQVTLNNGESIDITHDLGYQPFFMVFVNETSLGASAWSLVGIPTTISGLYACGSNTSILNIFNNSGGTKTFKYFIFYDNVAGSNSIKLTESKNVLKIPKAGYDAKTEKDPNNLIFHSDLNTLKIVYQGKKLMTLGAAGGYSFPHNSPLPSTSCMMIFCQFPDGKVTPVNHYGVKNTKSYNDAKNNGIDLNTIISLYYDNKNIYFDSDGGYSPAIDVTFVWLIFEASL